MKSRAFSLTEILIVVLILMLLAALLLPVFMRAKSTSKEVPCASNLRQLYTAWSLYLSSNDDRFPPRLDEVLYDTPSAKPILKCPSDNTGGANDTVSARLHTAVSYFYLLNIDGFRQALAQADPNAGIAFCVLHGERVASTMDYVPLRDTTGLVLRLRRDGSVQHAKVGNWCGPMGPNGRLQGRQHWSLLSDTHCVEPYCYGLPEPCN